MRRLRPHHCALAAVVIAFASTSHAAGPAPELFAQDVVSTDGDELGGALTPDGKTFFFVKRTPSTLQSSVIVICEAHARGDRWEAPEIAPFSGEFKDFDPAISPDGAELFFTSTRPVTGERKRDTDLWVVRRTATGWSAPVNVGPPVDTDAFEIGCSVASDGTLYFSAARPGGRGGLDLYRSSRVDGKYAEPESLGDSVNTPFDETDPFVAPDGRYVLFASQGRPGAALGGGAAYPRSDIYITYRTTDGWSPPKRLGDAVNSPADESNPFVSPDGRYLYFTSERGFATVPMPQRLSYGALERALHAPRNGLGDIYRVDTSAAGIVR